MLPVEYRHGEFMRSRYGITQKLSLIFFLFFLIFSGTVYLLLFNVQHMVQTTENIVEKNNRIDQLTEILLSSLLDMEANHKKLKLLKKEKYSQFFEEAKANFESALQQAMALQAPGSKTGRIWEDFIYSYFRHKSGLWDQESKPPPGMNFVSDQVVTRWIDRITRIKRQNQREIDLALLDLNEQSRKSARNGLYGFCVSIIVGVLGLFFISRSIFTPLKTLTEELKRLSVDKVYKPISLKGGNEFQELADAYNDMSRQLYEEENIRNEFIASLSHEIRTPLSSIHESVNMIIEEVFGPMNPKQLKFLKIASIEIERIKRLLNHLLNVSILEADPTTKNYTRLDCRKLIHSGFYSFASLAEKKKINLSIQASQKIPPLYGVREELQQVFVNIIGNAIKYSPENSTVTVTVKRAKKMISFDVSDNGPGIPEEEMSLIFTRYYRTANVRNHQDGVGLGLSISRKIVADYGGTLSVKNNEKAGCTFTFTLPLKRKS